MDHRRTRAIFLGHPDPPELSTTSRTRATRSSSARRTDANLKTGDVLNGPPEEMAAHPPIATVRRPPQAREKPRLGEWFPAYMPEPTATPREGMHWAPTRCIRVASPAMWQRLQLPAIAQPGPWSWLQPADRHQGEERS
jgi:hypothetical protein